MKSHLYYTSFLLSIFISVSERSNSQSWQWAKTIPMNTSESGVRSGIAVDPVNGDVYTTGYFSGTVDFDPGADTFNLTTPEYIYECYDYSCDCYYQCIDYLSYMFILKVDAAGHFLWAKAMGGSVSWDFCSAISIVLDPSGAGAVYTTGSFYGTVDFDPGNGTFNMTAPPGCYPDPPCGDIFISKIDRSGNFEWAKAIGGPDGEGVQSITVDPGNGDVYTTGSFYGTSDFDPGPDIFNLSSVGYYDIFISKLDAEGNFVWAKAIGGIGHDYSQSIAFDASVSGGVYTTGYFELTADFDPGSEIFNLTAIMYHDMFISKLDGSGNFVWAKSMGGAYSACEGRSIAFDPTGSGAVYTTGDYYGTIDFDPGPETFNISGNGNFFTKLDDQGNFVWAKTINSGYVGNGYDRSLSIDHENGDVFTTGSFSNTLDFDPGADTFHLTSSGSGDVYICALDSSGNFRWAISMGGILYDESFSIILDSIGNLHVTGCYYSPSIVFGSDTLLNTGSGSYDIFIAKLELPPPYSNVVTSTGDSGPGTLRDIINSASPGSTITFSLAPFSQITLTSGEIVINKNLNLSGLGMLDLTLSGNNTSRIFHLLPGKNLDIENLALKNASALANGGAIFAEGSLTLENVLLQNNFQNGVPKAMTISPGGLVTVNGNVEIKN